MKPQHEFSLLIEAFKKRVCDYAEKPNAQQYIIDRDWAIIEAWYNVLDYVNRVEANQIMSELLRKSLEKELEDYMRSECRNQ